MGSLMSGLGAKGGRFPTYNELVGDFERLFEASGRDFARFYDAVKALAALPKDQRRARLQSKS